MGTEWPDEALGRFAAMARPAYRGKDPAHDWSHVRRIWSRLPWLAQEFDGIDVDRAAFLAAFHGLGHRLRSDAALRDVAADRLHEQGRPRHEIAEMLEAVDRHLTSPATPEEFVVHDANMLEVVGAFGIAKAFTRGGADRQSYEETIAIYRGFLDAARFFTRVGRAIGPTRKAYAEAFLARFADEEAPQPLDGRPARSARSATGVLEAMVAMLASGDPSDAAGVVAENYVDHQGLGTGPVAGVDGFALVVRTNHAAYRHQQISIEDLFGVEGRAVARLRWRGQRHDGQAVDRRTIDIVRVSEGRAVEHWGARA